MLSLVLVEKIEGGLPSPHSSLLECSMVFHITGTLLDMNHLMNFSRSEILDTLEFLQDSITHHYQ